MTTHVIIVAAGSGSRFGAELPKQLCMLGDLPVLMHTAIRIGRYLPQAKMTIVLSKQYTEYWEKMCEQHGFISPHVVVGGDTRWQSVKNAIQAIQPADDDYVLIHDGVRPVVKAEMLRRIVDGLSKAAGVIPVVPVTDSLRHVEADDRSYSVDRSTLVGVQTPQAFHGLEIKRAYELPYLPEFTDDASVYEAAGFGSPVLVEGSPLNIKITHPRDIEVATLFMGIK